MKLTRKNLIEFIKKEDFDFTSMYSYGNYFNEIVRTFTSPLEYTEGNEESDYYGIITYFSPKLGNSIVIDWSFQNNSHTPESFASQYLAYIKEADDLENSFNLIIPC